MSTDSIKIKIQAIYPDTITPKRAHPTDSGLDLYAHHIKAIYKNKGGGFEHCEECRESTTYIVLKPGERALVDTGIRATVGPGYEIQIRPRSGMALRSGITVLNTPGTVDESYRNDIAVILINHSSQEFEIDAGDRIAQMVVCPVMLFDVEIVQNLNSTERGTGGFGSTGV